MLAVAKEDLLALKKKNYRLIFVLGGPGTGKGTQCEKLVNEFKYTHISTGELIRDQIKKNTALGQECQVYTSKGLLVPYGLINTILIKAIVTSTAKNFLIDGFPKSMEQAIYFEKHIKEIGIIFNIQSSEEVCLNRILSRSSGKGEKREDDSSEEIIRNTLKEFNEQSEPVIQFYQKYGIVRYINSELEVSQVYESIKEQMFPAIYLIIGKKYSGKTTVGNHLAKKMGFKLIDYKEFVNSLPSTSKKNDDTYVLTQLINKLREEDSPRILLEEFPLKKENYIFFIKNCRKFEKVFYLNVNDNTATERMNKLGYTHPSYIGCSELNNKLYDFDGKKDIIDYLKAKSNLVELDVNNYFNLVIDNLIDKIAPSILLFSYNYDEDSKFKMTELIEYFESQLGYEVISIPQVIEENLQRMTTLGKEMKKYEIESSSIPVNLIIESLKLILFKETNNKYILVNFPHSTIEISEFEKSICKFQKMIVVSDSKNLNIQEGSIELYMKKDNRLFVYNKPSIDEYLVNEILGLNRDVTVVYGMPLSGKSTISTHLKTNYNYTMINFVEFIIELKRSKGNEQDPPQEPESVELTYPELLEGFRKYINSLPLNKKICLENIFAGVNELITDVEQVKKLFEITGRPRQFFEVSCRDEVLLDRWKEVKGLTEEVQEEQKNEFMETLEKPKKICEHLKSIAYKTIQIDTNYSAFKSKLNFDAAFGRNIIAIKHDYNLDIDSTIQLFAAKHQALVVSVPQLIYQQFYLNDENARKLEDSYCKKEIVRGNASTESVYIKYNPIHFDEILVNDLISQYVLDNSKQIEETGNFIILIGYLNSDLLSQNEVCFNLPLYEIKKLISLGQLSAFMQFTSQENVSVQEEEVAEMPYVELPKPKAKDPFDVDGDNNLDALDNIDAGKDNQDNAENPEETTKFKPENYVWTNYNGNPRNYIQTLLRLKKLPFEHNTLSNDDFEASLLSMIENHLYYWETDPSYAGMVTLINLI